MLTYHGKGGTLGRNLVLRCPQFGKLHFFVSDVVVYTLWWTVDSDTHVVCMDACISNCVVCRARARNEVQIHLVGGNLKVKIPVRVLFICDIFVFVNCRATTSFITVFLSVYYTVHTYCV